MNRLFSATASVIVCAGALASTTSTGPDHLGSTEQARITQHLQSVERELGQRDVSSLTESQRAARARNMRALAEYRTNGVFPHNHEHPAVLVPSFRDAHGTLCAMAYLIARSGNSDLVDRVARTNNHARIRDLADDAELLRWLEENGLTVSEAARIQPQYKDGNVDGGYVGATVGMTAVQAAVITWNVRRDIRKPGGWMPAVTAILTGVSGFMLGGVGMLMDADNEVPVTINLAAGAATGAFGIVNTIRALNAAARRSQEPTRDQSPRNALQWTPIVQPTIQGRTRLGLNVQF